MKILTLCYEYPPVGGGGGRVAHSVSAALARRGHRVRVQTAWMPGLGKMEICDGVEVHRSYAFRRRADRCSVPEMAGYLATSLLPSLRHIREWNPDVVHAHFAVPTGALALACRILTKKPYVLTVHLGDLPGGNPEQTASLFRKLDPLIRPIWKHAGGISASSSFSAGLAASAYGVSPRVILNGLGMQGRKSEASAPGTPLRLAAVGRFQPQKNFPWLMSTLAGAGFPWHLTLIGDGEERGEIEDAIRRGGISGRVSLPGWVSEETVRRVLGESDILLMPSLSEGNPIIGIEALKAGAAILGSDAGGLSDLIEDGKNGFRIPLSVPGLYVQRLGELAADHDQLWRMKKESHALAMRFDIEKIADEFQALLRESIGLNPPSAHDSHG